MVKNQKPTRQGFIKSTIHSNEKTKGQQKVLSVLTYTKFKQRVDYLMTPELTWDSVELLLLTPLSSCFLCDPKPLRELVPNSENKPLTQKYDRLKGEKNNGLDS